MSSAMDQQLSEADRRSGARLPTAKSPRSSKDGTLIWRAADGMTLLAGANL